MGFCIYPRNAISSVTAAITTIESNAPIIVGKGRDEKEMGIDGAPTGIRLGKSSRSAINATIPNTIGGIAARQMRVEVYGAYFSGWGPMTLVVLAQRPREFQDET